MPCPSTIIIRSSLPGLVAPFGMVSHYLLDHDLQCAAIAHLDDVDAAYETTLALTVDVVVSNRNSNWLDALANLNLLDACWNIANVVATTIVVEVPLTDNGVVVRADSLVELKTDGNSAIVANIEW